MSYSRQYTRRFVRTEWTPSGLSYTASEDGTDGASMAHATTLISSLEPALWPDVGGDFKNVWDECLGAFWSRWRKPCESSERGW